MDGKSKVIEVWFDFQEVFDIALDQVDLTYATEEDMEGLLRLAGELDFVMSQTGEEVVEAIAQVEKFTQILSGIKHKRDWLFGIILTWLCEKVEYHNSIVEKRVEITRFEIFQRSGAWTEWDNFNDWATDATGVKYSQWHAWMRAVQVWLESPEGQQVLSEHEVTQEEFIENVPMGKAIRSAATVSDGSLQDHQWEAVVDESATVADLNRALKQTPEEAVAEAVIKEAIKNVEAADAKRFVDEGNPHPVLKVSYDPHSNVMWLKGYLAGGKPIDKALLEFYTPNTAFEQSMIEKIVSFVQGVIDSLIISVDPGVNSADALFNALEAHKMELEDVRV